MVVPGGVLFLISEVPLHLVRQSLISISEASIDIGPPRLHPPFTSLRLPLLHYSQA